MAVRVAVIGCGAAGLCAVRHLSSRPSVFSVTAFELSGEVGGTWVYTDRVGTDQNGIPIHSSMYRNLRTNLPKEVMAFPDFEFNKDLPSFIHHTDVLEYLKAYASHFELLKHIKFQTMVVEVDPVECEPPATTTMLGQKWKVVSVPVTDRNNPVTEEYDAVIICNGHYAVPHIPDIPGLETFEGDIMHSHNYRSPEPFQDKTVLCLGAAASGQDISVELASTAAKVYLCHNNPPLQTVIPNNLLQKPGISLVQGSTVTLLNGEELCVDVILFCTGYHYHFPFLTNRCRIHIEDERITPLYKHILHTDFPSLSFIGICKTVCPFPLFHVQIQLVLAVLDGSITLPSKDEMDADIEIDYQKRKGEGLPHRHSHTMGKRQWAYNKEIAQIAGCPKVPAFVENLYDAVHATRVKDVVQYKNENYIILDEERFAVAN